MNIINKHISRISFFLFILTVFATIFVFFSACTKINSKANDEQPVDAGNNTANPASDDKNDNNDNISHSSDTDSSNNTASGTLDITVNTSAPTSPTPTTSSNPEVVSPPKPQLPEYDYTSCVPESESVEDGYYSDAVFLGDSRTDGFRLYSGLTTPTYLSAKSISVINIGSERVISAGDGSYVSILNALSWKEYGKVYIMLGINEIGISPSSYALYYSDLIKTVKEIQPNAIIYLQAIIPVSEKKDSEQTIYNNSNILKFNAEIKKLADEHSVYYIDTYSALADENGYLPADATFDGVHLTGSYCKVWREYLNTHTVNPDEYAQPRTYEDRKEYIFENPDDTLPSDNPDETSSPFESETEPNNSESNPKQDEQSGAVEPDISTTAPKDYVSSANLKF